VPDSRTVFHEPHVIGLSSQKTRTGQALAPAASPDGTIGLDPECGRGWPCDRQHVSVFHPFFTHP
jgi:hypothetical protein